LASELGPVTPNNQKETWDDQGPPGEIWGYLKRPTNVGDEAWTHNL